MSWGEVKKTWANKAKEVPDPDSQLSPDLLKMKKIMTFNKYHSLSKNKNR